MTDLAIRAPIGDVYDLLVEPERWVHAWQDAVRIVRVGHADPEGVGGSFDAVVRAPLGYRLSATITTVAADRPRCLQMTVAGGLEGQARWNLAEADGITQAIFAWEVRSTMRWLNVLTPVMRPVFERSHHVVVRHAADAAAASLGADLLTVASRTGSVSARGVGSSRRSCGPVPGGAGSRRGTPGP